MKSTEIRTLKQKYSVNKMEKSNNKYAGQWNRIMGILCRGLMGQQLSIQELANECEVSTKTISRDINVIKNFLANNSEQLDNIEIEYDKKSNKYNISMKGFLDNKEVFALVEILIGSRVLHKDDLDNIVNKLKKFTKGKDREMLGELVGKELLHYNSVKLDHREESVFNSDKTNSENYLIDNVWALTNAIHKRKEISINYYKMDGNKIERRIIPLSIMVNEYYFYLIAAKADDEEFSPRYFRVDRITEIIEHRATTRNINKYRFDEGALRSQIQFMWPGTLMNIAFEFTGPSVQAILDRIPTAQCTRDDKTGKNIITAEVYGDGIKMYLLSQGSWVKVLRPKRLVEEIKGEIEKMGCMYC